MIIQIDTREKARAIKKIIASFDAAGITTISSKLPFADYMSYDNPRLVVDRKQSLTELAANFSDVTEIDPKTGRPKKYGDGTLKTPRRRFLRELEGAQKLGIKIVILCEHGGTIRSLEDVRGWQNPRKAESPMCISGERLYKLLLWITNRYDVDLQFCDKADTGKRIIEILSGGMPPE